jgi:IPT/TIG domain.
MRKLFMSGMLTLILVVGLDACKDMGNEVPPTIPSPIIDLIQPDSAAIGDTVTITGSRFGALQGTSSVQFTPGVVGAVAAWSDALIRVKVPVGATSGVVSVTVNGVASVGFPFKTSTTSTLVSFSSQVLPILVNNCAVSGCHTGPSPAATFNPSTYSGLRAGGFTYHTDVVIAGDSTNSGLMKMIRGSNNLYGFRMPQGGQYFTTGLPDSMIVTIGTWIKQGALNN